MLVALEFLEDCPNDDVCLIWYVSSCILRKLGGTMLPRSLQFTFGLALVVSSVLPLVCGVEVFNMARKI